MFSVVLYLTNKVRGIQTYDYAVFVCLLTHFRRYVHVLLLARVTKER